MEKHVTGVLEFNNKIRNELLKKNIGKYSLYEGKLSPSIGEYTKIETKEPLVSLTDGKSVLEFTQDGQTPYSDEINKKYFINGREKDIFGVKQLTSDEYSIWNDTTKDYTQYIDEIFSDDSITKHIDYVNNLLAGNDISNALRMTELGIVRNINVPGAMQGAVTTNVWNFSGKDTKMGLITNQLYARTLYQASIFNSDRQRAKIKIDGEEYTKQYLTPSLINKYGNTEQNIYELSNILSLNDGEQRIREDLSQEATINDLDNNGSVLFLTKQIKKAQDDKTYNYKFISREGYFNSEEQGKFDYNSIIKEINKYGNYATYGMYSEGDNPQTESIVNEDAIKESDSSEFGEYTNIKGIHNSSKLSENSLIFKTNNLFNQHKINTLIGRFCTSPKDRNDVVDFIDTAKSKYGNSHGRNLLTLDKKVTNINGYENPYCRTWTFHHQYNQVKDLIRPFTDENGNFYANGEVQNALNRENRAYSDGIDGITRLNNNSVLQNNGFVKITPYKTDEEGSKIKNCMFSIENLAWKDVKKDKKFIDKEQTGPNGGRIMWFPPYDLEFNESVNVDWNSNDFIGRGEKMYTYKNTDRRGSLSFTLLIDHPAVINKVTEDNIEGMGKEKDIEGDILRFFAGCNLLEPNKIEEKTEITSSTIPNEEIEVNNPKSISFKIYFPNNFAGYNKGKYEDFKDYIIDYEGSGIPLTDLTESQQNYWWEYIAVGNQTCIPLNPSEFNGYEISNSGITETAQKNDERYKSRFIKNTATSDGKPLYHYHADVKNRESFKNPLSYYDSNSSCLNLKVNKQTESEVTSGTSEGIFSFVELMVALIESKNLLYSKKVYQNIHDYLKGLLNEEGKDNVLKLRKIFYETGMKFKSIIYRASADKNNPNTADDLAKRRSDVVIDFLKKNGLTFENDDIKYVAYEYSKVSGSDNKPSDDIENKENRFCEFTLFYNAPKSTELSKTSQNDKKKEEEKPVSAWTFDNYFSVITGNSDVLSIFNSYDFFNFKDSAQVRFDSIKEFDLNDYTKLNHEIRSYIEGYTESESASAETYRKDSLHLAYSIAQSKDNAYEYFIQRAREITEKMERNYGDAKVRKAKLKYDNKVSECEKSKTTKEQYKTDIKQTISKQNELLKKLDSELSKSELSQTMKEINKLDDNKTKLIEKRGKEETKYEKLNTEKEEAYVSYINAISNSNTEKNPTIQNLIKELENVNKTIKKYKLQINIKTSEQKKYDISENKDLYNLDIKVKVEIQKYEKIMSETPVNNEKKKEATKRVKEAKEDYERKRKEIETEYNKLQNEIDSLKESSEYVNAISRSKQLENEIKEKQKKNDISLNSAIAFFYATGISEDSIKDDGSTYPFGVFNPRDYNKDDDGNERNPGSDFTTVAKYSFEVMFKHYLLIQTTEQYIKEEQHYKAYEIMVSQNKVEFLESLLNDILINSVYCKEKEGGCTEEESEKTAKDLEELNNYFTKILIPELNKRLKDEAEAAKKAKESENAQNLSQEDTKVTDDTHKNANNNTNVIREWKQILSGDTVYRYENEASYFARLEKDNPLVFKKLVDKFKYFDPAFHSMSPEGFNARLNFLHQCTRQGATINKQSGSNKNGTSVRNLAFGRMPVCVIRIGDFIHTKAIIESMTINYDAANGILWDLNQEGAGVQPMFAKVTLNIILLGGQSLAAPVTKLQNALSFNYYANTEVYDNRSDATSYNNNKIVYDKSFVMENESNTTE